MGFEVMEMVKVNVWVPSSILILFKRKGKEFSSGFQFTSCERVAETCKMKRTKILCQ